MLIGKLGLNTIANETVQKGYEQTHAISQRAGDYSRVSNFGSETKIGSSVFIQSNEQAAQDGEQATAANMKDVMHTFEQFEEKQSYTHNATLANLRSSNLDMQA